MADEDQHRRVMAASNLTTAGSGLMDDGSVEVD